MGIATMAKCAVQQYTSVSKAGMQRMPLLVCTLTKRFCVTTVGGVRKTSAGRKTVRRGSWWRNMHMHHHTHDEATKRDNDQRNRKLVWSIEEKIAKEKLDD